MSKSNDAIIKDSVNYALKNFMEHG
jgi:hypothetical protein